MDNLIGGRILRLMKDKNMTQKDLADRAGVAEITVSRYIKGLRTPRTLILNDIALALEVPVEDLIGTKEDNLKQMIRNSYGDKSLTVLEEFTKLPLSNREMVLDIIKWLQ